MIGTTLGTYNVLSKLGEGGMGEVYRARDTSLGRDVAIKVLPATVAADPDRLARFEREARLLASLSHANIAQIYGLEHDGQRFLVMELAAGEDLTARIERGPMPLEDVLSVATQIAHALEAAHERGIVHRDLKPGNIKVDADGAVKVLDFGLAKALAPAGEMDSAAAMNSPTLTAQATAAGIILGTAAYMSPEQARGRDADKRADIWAFGVVVFEMLTGTRLFHGETISDTLAAVLRQDIPWDTLPAGLPAEVVRLLRRCLERDRKNRLHDVADARIVLEELARGGAKDEAPRVVAAPARGRTVWLVAGGIAAASFLFGVIGGRALAPAPAAGAARTIRLTVPMPRGVTRVGSPAVSPDGRFVVFSASMGTQGSRLYLQWLDQALPIALDRTDGASQPSISPDGRWILFRRRNRLERIAVDGGEPLGVADASGAAPGQAWLADGTIVFGPSWLAPLQAVSAEGGNPRTVSTLDSARGEIGHWFPSPLPDPQKVLFTVWKKGAGLNDSEIAVLDLATGRHQVLFKGAEGRYLAPGFIVFFRAGAYHAVRFDADTLQVDGEPVRVLEDAYGNSPQGEVTNTALVAGGTLAYLSGPLTTLRTLTWISEGGKAEPLPFPARPYSGISLSPDGRRAAISTLDAGRHVISVIDFDRRAEDVLDLPGSNWSPVWHPDGRRLAFRSMLKGDFDTYWKDLGTSAPSEPLLVTDQDESPDAFLPDGRGLLVDQSEPTGGYFPKLLPLDPVATPKTIAPLQANGDLKPSRDGRFVAILSSRTGTLEAYVVPLSGDAAPERVSTRGAVALAWAHNGRELLYLRPPEIVAATFTTDGGRFRVTGERVWARVEGLYRDTIEAAPDGRVLVALAAEEDTRSIRVIVNWQQEIAAKFAER